MKQEGIRGFEMKTKITKLKLRNVLLKKAMAEILPWETYEKILERYTKLLSERKIEE